MRCALGRGGIGAIKREGDGKTPIGSFRLMRLFARGNNIAASTSLLPRRPISSCMGWCDAVGDRNYNREVALPYPASCETMYRDDHLYDYCIVMDYNISRHLSRGGSAIFFHLAHRDYRATEGCVALARRDMQWLLPRIGPQTRLTVGY